MPHADGDVVLRHTAAAMPHAGDDIVSPPHAGRDRRPVGDRMAPAGTPRQIGSRRPVPEPPVVS
jgi:hypothetical protein